MALTVLRPSEQTFRTFRPALTTPVVSAEGARTVVALRGETDFFDSPGLSDVLSHVIASSDGDVVVDLAEAEFIDTATARIFAVAQHLLDRRDRALTFRSPSRSAALLLDLFRLTELIEAPLGSQVGPDVSPISA